MARFYPSYIYKWASKVSHTSYGKKVRQVGTQEVNICDIVKPITKYTNFIKDKNKVISEFEKASK